LTAICLAQKQPQSSTVQSALLIDFDLHPIFGAASAQGK